jgi:hypothetical protein
MSLKVDETKIYDSAYREQALSRITEALNNDDRIGGALLVGSGSQGFLDRYSDVDIAVLVCDEAELEEVYADWWNVVCSLLSVISAFKSPPRHLYGFFLDRFMELDMSFQKKQELYEYSPNWRILFDKYGIISSLMKPKPKPDVNMLAAHEKRVQDSWYYVIHCISSIQRNQLLRASLFIRLLRDETVLMAGLSRGLETSVNSYFDETDKLPTEVKRRLYDSFPTNMKPSELFRALKTVVDVYYDEAALVNENLGLDKAVKLKSDILEYLSAFEN